MSERPVRLAKTLAHESIALDYANKKKHLRVPSNIDEFKLRKCSVNVTRLSDETILRWITTGTISKSNANSKAGTSKEVLRSDSEKGLVNVVKNVPAKVKATNAATKVKFDGVPAAHGSSDESQPGTSKKLLHNRKILRDTRKRAKVDASTAKPVEPIHPPAAHNDEMPESSASTGRKQATTSKRVLHSRHIDDMTMEKTNVTVRTVPKQRTEKATATIATQTSPIVENINETANPEQLDDSLKDPGHAVAPKKSRKRKTIYHWNIVKMTVTKSNHVQKKIKNGSVNAQTNLISKRRKSARKSLKKAIAKMVEKNAVVVRSDDENKSVSKLAPAPILRNDSNVVTRTKKRLPMQEIVRYINRSDYSIVFILVIVLFCHFFFVSDKPAEP